MKLNELGKYSSSRLNQKLEQKFGFKMRTAGLTEARARELLAKVEENLKLFKQKNGHLLSEKNSHYTELLLMRQGITRWLSEQAQNKFSSRHYVVEGEMEQAQTVLAAKDLVDRIQKMLEDTSAMLAEDLPPLLDSVRDQIGSEQAAAFNSSVNSSLTSLLESLKQTRETVDGAVRGLTGEQAAPMSMPTEPAVAAEPAAEPEGDDFAATDAATGGTAELGRETR